MYAPTLGLPPCRSGVGRAVCAFTDRDISIRRNVARGRLLERGRVGVRIGSPRPADRESPLHLTLAQEISRGERMNYTLQKAVELGVLRASSRSRVSAPWCAFRASVASVAPSTCAWVVRAASEQCGRTRVPRLLPVATMDEWLSGVVPGLKLLLIRKEGACRLSELAPDPSITLLIGPEGGFAAEEASTGRAGRLPSATARPAGPAHRDRGGRGPLRPAGAVGAISP